MGLPSTPRMAAACVAAACMAGCGDDMPAAAGDSGTSFGNAIAVAGPNQLSGAGLTVVLDGSESSDPDSDPLRYRWTQTRGPDVTGGVGSLEGAQPQFRAPQEVVTLGFRLVVHDGDADSAPDEVFVTVLEDPAAAFFVDGVNGNDESGVGSAAQPFASLSRAAQAATGGQDIYLRTLGQTERYGGPDMALTLHDGTSLYGGFDEAWIRDEVARPTLVSTDHRGIDYDAVVTRDVTVSGLVLQTADSPAPDADVTALRARGLADVSFTVVRNQLQSGNVNTTLGVARDPGDSYGLLLSGFAAVLVADNTIRAGSGGNGAEGEPFVGPNTKGVNGSPGSGPRPGGAGRLPNCHCNGGRGGQGGVPNDGDGERGSHGTGPGGNGGAGGTGGSNENGKPGQNGLPGSQGGDGAGGSGAGAASAERFQNGTGRSGNAGEDGGGGGGGGGGDATLTAPGRGGGGGGSGGLGGAGGRGGAGGGASIGIYLFGIAQATLTDNVIVSGQGGLGNSGGVGQIGGGGSSGAAGATGTGGDGGRGGDGAEGGQGGLGGAGAGGPSFGIHVGPLMVPVIRRATVTTGDGGAGGFGGAGFGGEGGFSYAIFDADPSMGAAWDPQDITATFGTAGPGGRSQDDARDGAAGQAGVRNF